MKKKFVYLLLCLLIFGSSCKERGVFEKQEVVLVSVPPYKFFVKKIAAETVKISLVVPPGADPHTFEPVPRQVLEAAKAKIWFQNGIGFEERLKNVLLSFQPNLKVIDLRLSLLKDSGEMNRNHLEAMDPHIWLSPKLVQKQVEEIAAVLIKQYPENKEIYQKNLKALLKELKNLDEKILSILTPLKKRMILVSHPAFGYFCKDYNLEQLSIESEGREPTPYRLDMVLKRAREAKIGTLFVQVQHRSKGSKLIAKELGAKIVLVDPLREDYLENMVEIAQKFAFQEESRKS